MMHWSTEARNLLDRAVREAGERAARDGADAAEVAEDLRLRAEQELAARGLPAVATADVESVLARLGIDRPHDRTAPVPPAGAPAGPRKRRGCFPLFGAALVWLLPLVALLWEVVAKLTAGQMSCGALFFDPIPTWFHTLLVATVPAANFIGWRRATRDYDPRWKRIHSILWGAALAVSLWYAARFVTVIPMALIGLVGILYLGIGLLALLPLSPYFGLAGVLVYRSRFDAPGRGRFLGFSGALLALLLLLLPSWVTWHGLELADSPDASDRARGVRLLRAWGDRTVLADRCFGVVRSREFGTVDWMNPMEVTESGSNLDLAALFYRVYGEPFYATSWYGRKSGLRGEARRVDVFFDNGQGGDAVGQDLTGLSLSSSRLDGHIEPDLASAYLEWTLVFANASTLEREARAQLALPPGATVSRLTLWINGEEREAAFGGRSQVTEAYKKVVRARRDPVLVNHCGQDRVMMQCFPVPANGTMKVRLGITVPTPLAGADRTVVRLPAILERNFSLQRTEHHDVWIDCAGGLATPDATWTAKTNSLGGVELHAGLPVATLVEGLAPLRASRDPSRHEVDSPDPIKPPHRIVTRVTAAPQTAPGRVVLVLDASRGLHDDTVKALAALPDAWPGVELGLVAAARDELFAIEAKPWTKETVDALRREVGRLPFEGGQDNAPALTKAWDLASASKRGVVLWLHGPCHELLSTPDALRQRAERSAHGPQIVAWQLTSGPHRLVEKLDTLRGCRNEGVTHDIGAALHDWFAQKQSDVAYEVVRSREQAAPADAHRIESPHPARLWARTQVDTLLEQHAPTATDEATGLATDYFLVTPVSGAVVLETKQQFDEAGLEAMSSKVATIVPEPSTWALALAGAAILGLRAWRRRTKAA